MFDGLGRLLQGGLARAVFTELLIRPAVVRDRAVFKQPDAGGEFLDEVPVVRYEQQRLRIVAQRVLDPLAAGDVEMVRRLVEDEEIDFPAHEHAQPQPGQLAARERRHGLEHILAAKAVGAELVARLLRRALALVEHRVEHGALRHGKADDLRQVCRAHGRPALHPAGIRRLFVHDEPQKRRLAGAVVADEGDALAPLHLQGDALKELLFPKGLAEAPDAQHLVPGSGGVLIEPLEQLRAGLAGGGQLVTLL